MQGRKSATIVLDKLKVKELFDVIVTREDHVYRLEQLKIALRKLDIRPKEAIFVGDTVWDKEAGTRLGCITLIIKNNISNVLDVKHKIRELLGDPC